MVISVIGRDLESVTEGRNECDVGGLGAFDGAV